MKICYILGHFYPHVGGVENLFMDYAKGMAARGHQVRVVTSNSGGITGTRKMNGFEIYYYPWQQFLDHPLPRKKDLSEHVCWADLVHTTTFTTANSARKLCKKHQRNIIITIHEVLGDKWYWIEPNRWKAAALRWYEKHVCCKKYDIYHMISEATKRDYIQYYGDRKGMVRIYNPVDEEIQKLPEQSKISLHQVFQISEQDKVVLYYGRPGQSKGIFVYLNALAILIQEYHPKHLEEYKFCFLLADDPEKQKKIFLDTVKRKGMDNYILVHSSLKRADLFRCIEQADFIVVPSITEGFGFSATEACVLDKCLIHSDAGALPEVVSGKTLAFKNRDSRDLADKLKLAIENGENIFTVTPKRHFYLNDILTELEKLYQLQIVKE